MTGKYPMKVVKGYVNSRPGMQVGTKLEGDVYRDASGKLVFDEQGIQFIKQLGVEWVMLRHAQVPEQTLECYQELSYELGKRGLKIFRLENYELHNMSSVTLGLPDKDEYIARYLEYITNLGKAGIHYATYAHMATVFGEAISINLSGAAPLAVVLTLPHLTVPSPLAIFTGPFPTAENLQRRNCGKTIPISLNRWYR